VEKKKKAAAVCFDVLYLKGRVEQRKTVKITGLHCRYSKKGTQRTRNKREYNISLTGDKRNKVPAVTH
jgi:hypothetical protein